MKELTSLEALEGTARRLNAATEAINEYLQNAETSLNALQVGVEVWLPETFISVDNVKHWQLGYARVGEKWAFAVRPCLRNVAQDDGELTVQLLPDQDAPVVPLLRSARLLRAGAVACVPALIWLLQNAAMSTAKEIEAVMKRVDPTWQRPIPALEFDQYVADERRAAKVDTKARAAGYRRHIKRAAEETKDLSLMLAKAKEPA